MALNLLYSETHPTPSLPASLVPRMACRVTVPLRCTDSWIFHEILLSHR